MLLVERDEVLEAALNQPCHAGAQTENGQHG
jgi:hypothetical protein